MNHPELYPYTKEELLEKMKRLAAAYTPEWKFDRENPDVGTALAMIYGDMFYDTVRRYNRLQEKNRTAFFDSLGTRLRPSVPAKGYVSFSLSSSEFGGVEVPKGFLIMSEGLGEEGRSVPFETQDSVYALPSRLEHMFLVDGENDRIQCIYCQTAEKRSSVPFHLFQSSEENLQEHMFAMGQGEVLYVKGPAEVCLILVPFRFADNQEALMEYFLDETAVVFEYSTPEGFVPFGSRRKENGQLVFPLEREDAAPGILSFSGRETYWIRCRFLKPYTEDDFVIQEIRLTSRARDMAPDVVQTENGEEQTGEIFPFGEKPAPYQEVYIAADQALSKAGSRVTLSFRLDYERIPLEDTGTSERDWKLVMKRTDFIPDPEYDVTVERVVWEYYNGMGWSRLFDGSYYDHIFNGGDGTMGQQFTLEFTCPSDAAPFLYNSTEARCIRIRILKMNNLFQIKGNYITPVISDLLFSFAYQGQGKIPEVLESFNNMEKREFPVKQMEQGPVNWIMFQGLGHREKKLYLKFTEPLSQGPVRILFSTEETFREKMVPLTYEYYGSHGFSPLSVMDQTEHMRKSGTIVFGGRPDFEKQSFWGERGYWLRLTKETAPLEREEQKKQEPVINGIFMNAVRVLAVQTMPEESFSIEPKEEHKVCRLLNQNVYDLEVWVNELESTSENQRKKLKAERSVREEWDREGKLIGFWVKWEETEDFCLSQSEDRHYLADKMRGEVYFSDGKHGAIPASGVGDTISISYRCGGGAEGNCPAGTVNQMSKTLGYLNRGENPRITIGGCDQETVAEAIRRTSAAICHQNRAVTAKDYEALAMEASRDVLKVKCFPNCNEKGSREPGSVTLVVLQKNFKEGRLYFDQVKGEVENYLLPRLEGNQAVLGRFYVTEPLFVKLECSLEIEISDFNEVFDVKRRVLTCLEEFLDPTTGNFHKKGWEIGRVPNEVQIKNALKEAVGRNRIRELRVSALVQSREGWIQADMESSDFQKFAVAVSGSHQITMTPRN